jgi:hypothetical protein
MYAMNATASMRGGLWTGIDMVVVVVCGSGSGSGRLCDGRRSWSMP